MKNQMLKIISLSLILLIIACDFLPNEVDNRPATVRFDLNEIFAADSRDRWREQPPNSVRPESPRFLSKISAEYEVKVAILEMTDFESESEFIYEWEESGQDSLWDVSGDTTADAWDQTINQFKSYTGDYYRYAGDYGLKVDSNVARGTVYVNPGLNYFYFALRQDQRTIEEAALFFYVEEGRENIINNVASDSSYEASEYYFISATINGSYQQMPGRIETYASLHTFDTTNVKRLNIVGIDSMPQINVDVPFKTGNHVLGYQYNPPGTTPDIINQAWYHQDDTTTYAAVVSSGAMPQGSVEVLSITESAVEGYFNFKAYRTDLQGAIIDSVDVTGGYFYIEPLIDAYPDVTDASDSLAYWPY